ncbi:50S ribosomal protein L5 [archaeon]|jgi:large subunit ribosomal protein L5|nr:50S ribosomal protein L5 [archaeon]MBT4373156.1 50S ribosomal protein L5 [archaeon]MBT4531501.1 50S ribosomal protein L5 [archaeon]MBT7001321.1 50S ribosomal protein L5 [archaeon]MBT7282193.1 50S ribosomal protein L5 [archaeon]
MADEKIKTENVMRTIKMEKVVLSVGGIGDNLEKGYKLLQLVTNRKPAKTKSNKRIPSLGVRPGLEIGAVVTIRKGKEELLKRLFIAIENKLKKKQISENNFSFGIKEYIEIPGVEYQRDLGILGFDVTVAFKRTGRRVKLKKVKRGKIPKRQVITREEIIKFMEKEFGIEFIGKLK